MHDEGEEHPWSNIPRYPVHTPTKCSSNNAAVNLIEPVSGPRSHLRYGLPDFEICLLDWLHPTLGCQRRHQCCDMLNKCIIRVTFFFSFHGHVTISPIYIHTCGGSASPCLRFSYWYDCAERPTTCEEFTLLTAGAMYGSHTYRISHDRSNRRATLLFTSVDLSMAENKTDLRFLSHQYTSTYRLRRIYWSFLI